MVFTLQLQTRMPAQHYESASVPAEMERKYKLQAKDTKALAVPYRKFQLEGTNSFVFHIYTPHLAETLNIPRGLHNLVFPERPNNSNTECSSV